MIIGSAFGIGWVARDILCSNFFRPLGRITFCVYLCHPFVLKASMGNLRQPLFLSDMTIVRDSRHEFLFSKQYKWVFPVGVCLIYPNFVLFGRNDPVHRP